MPNFFTQILETPTIMSKTLTKADIVSEIQKQNGYPERRSMEIVDLLLEIMKRTLASGEDVMISGFGKFQVKEKQERRGRNPATGEDLILAPRRVVKFKCSGRLRDLIK